MILKKCLGLFLILSHFSELYFDLPPVPLCHSHSVCSLREHSSLLLSCSPSSLLVFLYLHIKHTWVSTCIIFPLNTIKYTKPHKWSKSFSFYDFQQQYLCIDMDLLAFTVDVTNIGFDSAFIYTYFNVIPFDSGKFFLITVI